MRIISGKYKGRVIHPPKGLPTRPTTDFAKTGLFNILRSRIDFSSTRVLDLFSGTGNIALEFISEGAASVFAVDKNYNCIQFIAKVKRELNIENLEFQKADVFKFLSIEPPKPFDLVFADPPYDLPDMERIHQLVTDNRWLSDGGLLIIEHGSQTNLSGLKGFESQRTYGNVNFSIFSKD